MTSSTEKFEILSAYLDDEASEEECRLVEQWLDCDPLFRQQYQAQRQLKVAIRSLSASSLFDTETAADADLADNLIDLEPEPRSTQILDSNDLNAEDLNDSSLEEGRSEDLSIRTAIATNRYSRCSFTLLASRSRQLAGVLTAPQTAVFDAGTIPDASTCEYKSSDSYYSSPVLKSQTLIKISVALLAAVTAFSCGNIRMSRGKISLGGDRIRRAPEKVTEANGFLWQKHHLATFSVR